MARLECGPFAPPRCSFASLVVAARGQCEVVQAFLHPASARWLPCRCYGTGGSNLFLYQSGLESGSRRSCGLYPVRGVDRICYRTECGNRAAEFISKLVTSLFVTPPDISRPWRTGVW